MVFFFEPRGGLIKGSTWNIEGSKFKLYMGLDKYENEKLIRWGLPEDIWFHVDKLSSAHVYLRLPKGVDINQIPEETLEDCCQLVKANSIKGNKENNLSIVYTPWANLQKRADMDTGTIGFLDERERKYYLVEKRSNEIVNRLNKTKVEKAIDYEQERRVYDERVIKERKAQSKAVRDKQEQAAKQARAEKAQAELEKNEGYWSSGAAGGGGTVMHSNKSGAYWQNFKEEEEEEDLEMDMTQEELDAYIERIKSRKKAVQEQKDAQAKQRALDSPDSRKLQERGYTRAEAEAALSGNPIPTAEPKDETPPPPADEAAAGTAVMSASAPAFNPNASSFIPGGAAAPAPAPAPTIGLKVVHKTVVKLPLDAAIGVLFRNAYALPERPSGCGADGGTGDGTGEEGAEVGGEEEDEARAEERQELRRDERECVQAMFDESEITFKADPETSPESLDCSIQLLPSDGPSKDAKGKVRPPVRLEVFIDTAAPRYPDQIPVLAVSSGGLPEPRLRELTAHLAETAKENIGGPMVYAVASACQEILTEFMKEAKLRAEEKKKKADAQKSKIATAKMNLATGKTEQNIANKKAAQEAKSMTTMTWLDDFNEGPSQFEDDELGLTVVRAPR